MSTKKINVGLIGYGFSVTCFHLPFILPNPNLHVHAFLQRAAAPSDPSTAKPGSHCTVDYPNAKHYRTAEEFFADPEIDLVIVCSHTDTHATFAEMAMEKGKNVVVEKPFTRTSEEADRVIATAKRTGKLLTVFQNRRWDGDFQTVKHLMDKGALGTITEFENSYYQEMAPWVFGFPKEYSPGEGILFGLGTHTIDQVLLLFGRPARVTCFHRSNRGVDSDVEDTFMIILEYTGKQKNLLVTLKTGIVSPMQQQLSYFVRGTAGSFMKYGTDAQEPHAIAGLTTADPSFGIEPASLHGKLTTLKEFDGKCQSYDAESKKYIGRYPTITGRYLGYYENLVEAIRGGELEVKPEHSRDGIRLIELARESNERHAAVEWS